jgi:diguanylate cyclase (GGDEF)-like protein
MREFLARLFHSRAEKTAAGRGNAPRAAIGGGGSAGWRRTVIVASAGVALSVGAALSVAHWESQVAELAFNSRANNIAMTLQTGVNESFSKIVALRALFESANNNVTRADFQTFADRILAGQPAILSVSWIPRVRRDERRAHERAAVADGIADYRVRSIGLDGTIAVSPERDEYFPVYYTSERQRPHAIYGLDLGDDGMREHTLNRARDSDGLAASKSLVLQTGTGDRRGFFVVLPVYKPGAPHTTVDEHRANLAGFVQGVFNIDVMVDTILSGIKSPINFVIFPSAIEPTIDPLLIRTAGNRGAGGLSAFIAPGLHWAGEVKVADLQWRLEAVPSVPRSALSFVSAWVLLGAGLSLTAFGSAFVWSSARKSMRLLSAHAKVSELARSDALTAIPNRRAFVERLKAVCEAGRPVAVLYIDLDHFKDINDTLGHSTGDRLLQLVSERLQRAVRENDIVARFGGDEFAILLVDPPDAAALTAFAARVRASLAERYHIDGNEIATSATIGMTSSSKEVSESEALMMQADVALYRAKDDGRNCFRAYDAALDEKFRERVMIGDGIRRAIDNGELRLHYQPQVEITSGRLVGFEALVRWQHPTRGTVPPSMFIPIAEDTGAIIPLGNWVFEEACRQFAAWKAEGIAPQTLAVNLSAIQCKHASLESDFCEIMARHKIPPGLREIRAFLVMTRVPDK